MNYSVVGSAFSKKYGDVIFKITKDNIFNYYEIEMLKIYNGKCCCKLIYEDKKENFILIEKLIPGDKLCELNNLNDRIKIICNLIDNLVIPYYKNNEIAFYDTILEEAFNYCKKEQLYYKYVDTCKNLYNKIKNLNLPLYFLHNDLHSYNILKSGNTYKVIDPHGVIGEKIFEYPPFILNGFWCNKQDILYIINEICKYSNENKTIS